VATACALGGCSARPTQAPPRETVEGQVVARGRPLPFVLVSLHPEDIADPERYDGAADQDGSFTLQCPKGSYKLTINPLPAGAAGDPGAGALAGADGGGPAAIPHAYRNRDSTPISIDVPEGGKKGVKLDLP
jgi:hypothetical protein